jgi:hypothetical protein
VNCLSAPLVVQALLERITDWVGEVTDEDGLDLEGAGVGGVIACDGGVTCDLHARFKWLGQLGGLPVKPQAGGEFQNL